MLLKLEMKSSDLCALRVFLGGEKTVATLKPGSQVRHQSRRGGKALGSLGKMLVDGHRGQRADRRFFSSAHIYRVRCVL